MNNSSVVQLMQQEEQSTSGLDRESESIFVIFLSLVEVYCGSRRGLDVLAMSPDYYWKLYWQLLTADDMGWLVRAIQLPLDHRTNDDWFKMRPETRDFIIRKTQPMAAKAKDLISSWKMELST